MSDNPLAGILSNPDTLRYLGRKAGCRLAILATVMSGGGNVAAVGRAFGISKQSAHRMAVQARAVVASNLKG